VEECRVDVEAKDRWGHTPHDEAVKFHKEDVEEYLWTRVSG